VLGDLDVCLGTHIDDNFMLLISHCNYMIYVFQVVMSIWVTHCISLVHLFYGVIQEGVEYPTWGGITFFES
jgi:hypothetical protein